MNRKSEPDEWRLVEPIWDSLPRWFRWPALPYLAWLTIIMHRPRLMFSLSLAALALLVGLRSWLIGLDVGADQQLSWGIIIMLATGAFWFPSAVLAIIGPPFFLGSAAVLWAAARWEARNRTLGLTPKRRPARRSRSEVDPEGTA